jgi:hypothetical protein
VSHFEEIEDVLPVLQFVNIVQVIVNNVRASFAARRYTLVTCQLRTKVSSPTISAVSSTDRKEVLPRPDAPCAFSELELPREGRRPRGCESELCDSACFQR